MRVRGFAIFLLFLTLLYGVLALQIQVPFAFDPLGPKPLPLDLAALALGLVLVILIRPGKPLMIGRPQLGRCLWLFAILLFYQATWLSLGFLFSTTISLYLLSRLFHCSWMQGLMTALLAAVICYGLFNFVLQIPLPLGTLFSYGSG